MLYSTLKVSSVQDKKQCDPEEAAAKGKTTWGKWAVEQQNPLFSCQERIKVQLPCQHQDNQEKSGAKGRAQSAEFHKDNLAFPFSLFTVRTSGAATA